MQLQEWPFIRYVGKPGFSGWDKFGTLISKFEDKWWDIDIKNITMSHCDQTKCILLSHNLSVSSQECFVLKPECFG